MEVCDKCGGSGFIITINGECLKCPTCRGHGMVFDQPYDSDICPKCGAPFPTATDVSIISKNSVKYCYRCGTKILPPPS